MSACYFVRTAVVGLTRLIIYSSLNLRSMIRSKTLVFHTWDMFRNWYEYIKLRFTNLKLVLAKLYSGYMSKVLVVVTY